MDETFPTIRRWTSRLLSAIRRWSEWDLPFRSWWPWRTTRAQQQNLLRLIAVGTEERLELPSLLGRWAGDERGVQQRRVFRLARLLKEGMPLPVALEHVPGALRDEDVLAIRFGAQSGTLAASLRDALADAALPSPTRATLFRWTLGYGGIMTVAFVIVLTYIYVKIVPKFYAILEDFDIEPPDILKWSTSVAGFFVRFWWLAAIVVLGLIWSLFSVRPGRFVRRQILGRFFGPLRELRAAEVVRKLAVVARAGRPIAGALSTLARYHFDPATRAKLLYIRNEVEQGADVWQSMGSARLLTPPEVEVMATAERIGNRGWALEQLATEKRRTTMQRLERLSELCLPAMVFFLGAIVLLQALSLFVPLSKLLVAQL